MATGQLGTWTFGTTGGSQTVISIDPPEEQISDIAKPHLGLALGSYVPYDPGELIEGGEYKITIDDPGQIHFVDKDYSGSGTGILKAIRLTQTMTWTKPTPAGAAGGATRAFSGYIKSVKESQQVTGSRNTIELTIKVAGNVTKTASS